MSPVPDERARIRAAMDRILGGTAENSNGALTIVALAQEADVPRNALTQRRIDLKAEFSTRVRERVGSSEVETRLRETIAQLQARLANKNTELEQLRADVPAFVRTINVLTLENQQLREAHDQNRPAVVPLRPRRPTPVAEARRTIDVIERFYASARFPSRRDADRERTPVRVNPPSRDIHAGAVKRAVVFDLDGVLVNSFPVARMAFARAYAEVVGAGEPPFTEYESHSGRYFPDIMRIMGLPLAMEEPFVRESYRLAHTVPVYDGVPELLAELRDRGFVLAVATGKSGTRARSLLEVLGLLDQFAHVVGSDEVARSKPAPDIVERAVDLLDVSAAQALMVGDAVADMASARGAGVMAVAALWGETDETLLATRPDAVLRTPAELLALCPAVSTI